MTLSSRPACSWPELLSHLEGLWNRPRAQYLPDLLSHLRHDTIALLEPTMVGARMLISMYELPVAAQAWLADCATEADAWVLKVRESSDTAMAQTSDLAEQCQIFLRLIGAHLVKAADLIAARPAMTVDDPAREEIEQILTTLMASLNRLANASAGIRRGDYAWLKAMFDETERKRREARQGT